ncbi:MULTISPECIES: hypothetical protein [unclassified Nocardioides]|uniref:hypothetical protein n=1 Tax=unclassified Nocardioides TaxID=2615069 RepID=UPI00301477E9
MSTHPLPRPVDRDPGQVRTLLEGVAAVALLAGLVGGVASALVWATYQVVVLLLT